MKKALLFAVVVLTVVAWLRSAEYDEQYTLFLTGAVARPIWPEGAITAADVQALQAPQLDFARIASNLRATDVHPPLYFWLAAAWRWLLGSSLFTLRLLSVLCSGMTLWLIAWIARSAAIPVVPAILLTLGCYGFAYTGAIARGFAVTQMLNVAGVAVLLTTHDRRWPRFAAGLLFGAATFANYLAGFVACAALLHELIARRTRAGPALIGFVLWLPADMWFYLAQRESRAGQFAPFEWTSAVARLGMYSAANVFGGLPLYLDGIARTVVTMTLTLLLIGLATLIVLRWHNIATPRTRRLIAMAAVAAPIGLLLLGVAFNNTPIELRYLAFATPFIGLLLAAALPRRARHVVLVIQAVALLGLMLRPETMQPARATAVAAASLVRDGVILLPNGNDGVGIVGAFAVEAPPGARLLIVRPDESALHVRQRASHFPRVVLALLAQDHDSWDVLPVMREALADRCWRAAGSGINVLAFDRICGKGS